MESKKNITCRSRNVIYYLKCKLCMYETHIRKTIGDHVHGFKTRVNNHITKSRSENFPFMSLLALNEIIHN